MKNSVRRELLEKKCLEMQVEMEEWARQESLLLPFERLLLSVRIKGRRSLKTTNETIQAWDWVNVLDAVYGRSPIYGLVLRELRDSGNKPIRTVDFNTPYRLKKNDVAAVNAIFVGKGLLYRLGVVDRVLRYKDLPFCDRHLRLFKLA